MSTIKKKKCSNPFRLIFRQSSGNDRIIKFMHRSAAAVWRTGKILDSRTADERYNGGSSRGRQKTNGLNYVEI